MDLVIDHMEYEMTNKSDHRDPWRITLQYMLVSCSEKLTQTTMYHICRWACKINQVISNAANARKKNEMRLDPQEQQVICFSTSPRVVYYLLPMELITKCYESMVPIS